MVASVTLSDFHQDVESTVNLQHDCHHGHCGPTGSTPIIQEREKTSRTRSVILHSNDVRFIVNTSSLHNYSQISAATPPSLRSHPFTVADQNALRTAAAVQIRNKHTDLDEEEPNVDVPTIDNEPNLNQELLIPSPTALENPAFSRVKPPRSRQQQPTPVTLYVQFDSVCTQRVLK
jgi:hypothetical protein